MVLAGNVLAAGLEPMPFHRSAAPGGIPFSASTNRPHLAAFRAMPADSWLPGLIPVFAVERAGGWELRRRPAREQENFTDPLFFALAPHGEPELAGVSGRWEVAAGRDDGSTLRLTIELAAEGGEVSGRFDQNTDYRFASIVGGVCRTNRLELRVKYINDEYRLVAAPDAGQWTGRWRREDDSEGGSLRLFRNGPAPSESAGPATVDLIEWRRDDGGERRYHVAGEMPPPGWTRSERPIARVWRPADR